MPAILEKEGRTCSARCHRALGHKCRCICEGRHHGCAVAGDLPNTVEDVKAISRGEIPVGHTYHLLTIIKEA